MKYCLFPGCLIPARYPGIETASRKILSELKVGLTELNGASCCPDPIIIKSVDIKTWIALVARNLCLAEEEELDILTLCNGCYSTLKEVNELLKGDEKTKKDVNGILSMIGREFEGAIDVKHFAEVLYRDIGIEEVEKHVVKPLDGLKVAVHYGCHLLRPSEVLRLDDPEKPKFVDELVESLGADSLYYKHKMLCCGAGIRGSDKKGSLDVTRMKLSYVKEADADCIVDVCPFCHMQFDMGQVEIKRMFKEEFDIPILNLAELIGLSFGMKPDDFAFQTHKTSLIPLLSKLGLVSG